MQYIFKETTAESKLQTGGHHLPQASCLKQLVKLQ